MVLSKNPETCRLKWGVELSGGLFFFGSLKNMMLKTQFSAPAALITIVLNHNPDCRVKGVGRVLNTKNSSD